MSLATKVQDVLSIILARLPCECRLPGIKPPPSPALSAEEGELDGLLFDNGDPSWRDEAGEAVSSEGGRAGSARRAQPSYNRTGMYKRPGQRAGPAALDLESEAEEGMLEYDDDPSALGRGTLDRLPELARRYEPTLSLEDMAREEREQEERDKREEAATSFGKRFAHLPKTTLDDDFGGFEQGPPSADPLGAVPITEEHSSAGQAGRKDASDDEDDDAAEVSFGLGNEESDSES